MPDPSPALIKKCANDKPKNGDKGDANDKAKPVSDLDPNSADQKAPVVPQTGKTE